MNEACERCGSTRVDNGTYCRPCLSFLTGEAWLLEAAKLMRCGEYDKAAERFGDALDMVPGCHLGEDDLPALTPQLVALLWADRPAEVLQVIEERDDGEDPDMPTAQGLALLDLAQPLAAYEALDDACSRGARDDVDALRTHLGILATGGDAVDLSAFWLSMARVRYEQGDWLHAAVCLRLGGGIPASLVSASI